MSPIHALLGVLVLLLAFHQSKESQPYSWASHVCSSTWYRTAYTSQMTSRLKYKTYYTSCGLWGWGRCKRSRGYRTYYYVTKTTSVAEKNYYCCSGWRRSGRYCSTPICSGGCRHGSCSSPDTCSCYSGWYGSRCQYDRNECYSSNGGCQQVCTNTLGSYSCGCYRGYKTSGSRCFDYNECNSKPCRCASNSPACGVACTNTPGSFRCSCGNGYKLVSSGSTICTDVDECLQNVCQHTCINTIGSYKCICRQGYESRQNGAVCDDIDECKTSNGNCQHICNNIPGSRQCACKEGYQLEENKITCRDTDECSEDNPCEHSCTNNIGSYTCFCRKGYQLNPDNRTCSDFNECQSRKIDGLFNGKYSLSTCEQTCTNTKGSYICGCKNGFTLQSDGRSCKDIDECSMGTHQCSQRCINARGSYRCSCVTGYELDKDGRSCKRLPCPTLVQQPHGTMTCTGMATHDNCTFTCNHGYNLEGPSTITCMPTSRWSASQAICKAKLCDVLKPPFNAILSLPCFRTYGSSCNMRCEYGYYHTGNSTITCDLTANKKGVTWKNDFQCHHVKSCEPNPCRHGGTCIPLTSKEFQCDCSNTGYEGRMCEHGVIDMPLFPKLKANRQSSPLSFQAKPSREIQISIHSDDDQVVIQPSKLKLFKSRTKADFTLTSKQPGLKVTSFSILGESAKDYTNPADTVLFVSPENKIAKNNSVFKQIALLPGELPEGCYMKNTDMFKCPAQLSSTQSWQQNPSTRQFSTKGLVNVITRNGKTIPLSLIGTDFPSMSYDGILRRVKQLSQLSEDVRVKKTNSKEACTTTTIDVPQLMELVEYDVFAATFLREISKSTPPWLQFRGKKNSNSFDIKDIHASIASKSKSCSSLFNSSSAITYEPSIGSTISLGEEITLPDERGFCYAMDVCSLDVGFRLPSGSTRAIKSSTLFREMKNAGWDIDLTGATFPGDRTAKVTIGQTLWNGRKLEKLSSHQYKAVLKGKMKTKLENKQNVKISLDYQGDVFVDTDNITEAFHHGFTRNITGIFKGKAALNLTTTVLSKRVSIQLPENKVVGKTIFGDSTTCQKILFKWERVHRLLQGTPFKTMIRPVMNQPVFVALEHHVQGGQETEIVNINEYKTKLKQLSSIAPKLKSIMKDPQMDGLLKKENTKRWTNFIDEFDTLVADISSVIVTLRPAKHFKFSILISRLQSKLRDIKLLLKVIEPTPKTDTPVTESQFAAQVKSLISDLPPIPDVVFKRSAVSSSFQGFEIMFQGKLCLKRICFANKNIILGSNRSMRDQAKQQDPNQMSDNPGVIVQGRVLTSYQLGKVLSMRKGDNVWLNIPENQISSVLSFNPIIDIMGIRKVVNVEIQQNTLSFKTFGLLYGRHEAFLNVSANTDARDWSSLQYNVKGKMDRESSLPQQLQEKINNRIRDLAQKANKRIENAKSVAIDAKQKFDTFQQTLPGRLKALELLANKEKEISSKWRKAKKDYEKSKHEIHRRDTYSEDDTSQQPCKVEKCEWDCSSTDRECFFKSEKLKIPDTRENCKEVIRTIKMERVVRKSEMAYYWEDTLIRVETGSCGFRSTYASRAVSAAAGYAISKLVKVPFLGLFAFPFAFAIFALAGIFASFSCDWTYKMIPGPQVQVFYPKVRYVREFYTQEVTEIDCSQPIQILKETESYKTPQWTCKGGACIKVMNPTCIKKNMDCYEKERQYRSANSEKERRKAKKFHELNVLVNKLEIASIEHNKVKMKHKKLLEEIKFAKAQLKHLQLAKDRTEAAVSDVKTFPNTKLGLRLAKLLERTNNERTVHVSDFTFVGRQTTKEIPITTTVKSVDGKKKELPVLFDFDKEDISLHKINTKVIKELYEERRAPRRKRSIPEEVFSNINKTVNKTEGLQALQNHDLCLEAKKANEFYKEIVRSIEDIIDAREKNEVIISDDVKKLTSVYQNFKNITGNETSTGNDTEISNDITSAYLDYVDSIIKDKQNFSMMSWNETLISWKAFLEVLTKEKSFPNCAGAQDCIVDVGEDLDELYLYESDFPKANEIRMALSNVTIRLLDLISQNFTVEEFRSKILDLYYLLNHTEDTNVLCGRKPEITLISGLSEAVLENDTFTLFCNASSDTNVTYQWIHNNESVIHSEDGSLTVQKANTSDAGSYKCIATNRKGFAISNVTIITVHSKPSITAHPNETKTYADDGTGLLLVCNATSDPEPQFEWFFISQYPNSSAVKIYNDNGSFLYYEQPTKNYSGYYFCVASNVYGRATSRKAKVWVLEMLPGEPRLGARINITKSCKRPRGLSSCGNVNARRDLYQMKKALNSTLKNPTSKIENVSFVSDSLHNATVDFIYTSNNPGKDYNEPVSDPVIESFARKRKTLVNGLQTFHQKLRNGSSTIVSSSIEQIDGDADSLMVWVVPPECPRGQGPHSNGYMCYNCPPGTYGDTEGQCIPCPIKTYQYEQGQTRCKPCPYGFITKREGALSPDECFDMRPSPPRNLQATPEGSKMLRVKWVVPKTNSKSIWNYLIRFREKTGRFKTERVPRHVTTWTLTRLKKFTDYHIALYAVNSYGMTASKIIVKTGEDVPDAAPVIIQSIPVSYDRIKVTWKPIPVDQRNGIIRGYHIYFKESTQYEWSVFTTQTGNLTSTIVPGLQPYTEYCLKMSAFTSKGEYPNWKRASCKILKTPSRPVVVTGRALSRTEILLKFLKPGRSSQYNTFVVHYGTQQDRLRTTTACYSSSCVIRDLKEDTLYYFKVLEDVVQLGEAPSTLQIRTKRRGS